MPRILPSGLHVALSCESAKEAAKEGNFGFSVIIGLQLSKSFEAFPEVVNVVYLRPKDGVPGQLEPHDSNLRLSEINSDCCDWSKEDIEDFNSWMKQDFSQQWLRKSYDELVDALENTKAVVPDNLKGIFDWDDDYPVFNLDKPEEELPDSVIKVIGDLIKRDNVQSVSCPFNNRKVWRLLVDEQLRRADLTGLPKQKAFTLSGPDGGFSFNPTEWGGVVHIPYEGACMGDLFVVPKWRNLFPENGVEKGDDATLGDYANHYADPENGYSCHYLLVQRDLGELNCANRQIAGDRWILYESNKPYVKVNMSGMRGYLQ